MEAVVGGEISPLLRIDGCAAAEGDNVVTFAPDTPQNLSAPALLSGLGTPHQTGEDI